MSFNTTPRHLLAAAAFLLCSALSPAQRPPASTGAVEGLVLDSASQPIPSASVALAGNPAASVRSGPDGRFRIAGLSPALYRLTVSATGFDPAGADVTVAGGKTAGVEIRLQLSAVHTDITVSEGLDEVPLTTSSATRTPTALLDIPQSVQIIDRQLLLQQQAVTMSDIVRNASGVTVPNSSGGRAEDINMRGFTTSTVFKDGFRFDGFASRAPLEVANIEQVEVLKGPSSGLFGRLDPAGVVNLITKQPLPKRYLSVQVQRGGWRNWRPSIDAGGPLNRSRTLLYRFNILYQNSDSFRDFLYQQRVFVSPALTWNINDRSTLKYYADYQGGRSVIDRGLVAIGDRPAPLPPNRYLGNPYVPYPYKQGRTGLTFEHFFGPSWNFRSAERSNVAYAGYNGWQPTGLLANIANTTLLELSSGSTEQNLQQHYWQNDLVGRVSTGPVQHTVITGLDLNRETFDSQTYGTSQRVRINIYNPVYAFPLMTGGVTADTRNVNQYGGAFVQDQIKLLPRLKILVGARYDVAQLATTNNLRRTRTNTRNTAWTPRAGIVVNPTSFSSIYANYSRSFLPQSGTTVNGDPFNPERGEVYEAGVKLNLLSQRLVTSASVFQIRKRGILTADPFNTGFSIQVGEQRNRGVEFDATGKLSTHWTVLANYAHNDPRITRDNIYRPGNFLLSTPFDSGSFWTNYDFSGKRVAGVDLGGFNMGAGVFAVGKRWGDLDNSFLIPGYARLDLGMSYAIRRADKVRYRLAFNLNNLLDRNYYEGVRGRAGIIPGSPRSAIVTLQWIL